MIEIFSKEYYVFRDDNRITFFWAGTFSAQEDHNLFVMNKYHYLNSFFIDLSSNRDGLTLIWGKKY